ncbi:hypothetical protein ALC57_07203 [Trachymyrmex cornetzi]|uniref:Uncharacterized protein n=1 Tax=Trachymyrmex cornetzi TaxID=471704 RepID=A0A195E619_9HYME|nr:hypothetical protein ALC57_07203 [Trachymyrmex cornetzi]
MLWVHSLCADWRFNMNGVDLVSGSGIKVPMAILNCLYARQLCYEDPSCSAILEIIPRVCGPELVKYLQINLLSINLTELITLTNLNFITQFNKILYVYMFLFYFVFNYIRRELHPFLYNILNCGLKIFRNVTRINPKGTPGNGRHLDSHKGVRVCKRSFASRIAGNPGTDYHLFDRFCQGSWLAAAGCQAHNQEQVQRRVWTTQEISV